jgi:hypothetical protein
MFLQRVFINFIYSSRRETLIPRNRRQRMAATQRTKGRRKRTERRRRILERRMRRTLRARERRI